MKNLLKITFSDFESLTQNSLTVFLCLIIYRGLVINLLLKALNFFEKRFHFSMKKRHSFNPNSFTGKEIKELDETLAFEQRFGIYLEQGRRDLLIDFHRKHQFSIDWWNIKHALKFFEFKNGKVEFKISTKTKSRANFYSIIFFLMLSVSFLFIIIGINFLSVNTSYSIFFFTLSTPCIVLGYLFYTLSNPLIHATIIERNINMQSST